MIRVSALACLLCLSFAAGHMLVLNRAPGIFMTAAMRLMEEQGAPLHAFILAPAPSPEAQAVVRPAPDLAYSVCRFDLTKGRVLARGAVGEGYGSLAVFDAQTNNVLTLSLMARDQGPRAVELSLKGQGPGGTPNAVALTLESPRGLVLIRRLAPDSQSRQTVEALARDDECRLLPEAGRG